MSSSTASSARPKLAGVATRAIRPADRAPIGSILERTGVFTPDEITVALSLIDEGFEDPNGADPYRFVVAESPDDGRVLGYVCYGSTPLTNGTYDLYWIAVDPEIHGGGVGRSLVTAATDAIAAAGGRLLLIETSSRTDYSKTREFYERLGFVAEARVRDFYSPGDDRVIYSKRL